MTMRGSVLRSRWALVWAAALLAFGWPQRSHAAPQAPPAEVSQQPRQQPPQTIGRASYVLGPEDEIVIHAVDVPEISGKPQKLDPDGDLKLPMVGRVHAAGMTVDQLEREIVERLKVYLQEPDVSITVAESHSRPVSIVGAVASSGIKQLDGRKTLVEVLSQAGGLSADAGPVVRIARRVNQGRIPLPEAADDPSGAFSVVDIDARALLDGRTPEKNIVIEPNDVISVPRAEVAYVIGEVSRPGPVVLGGLHSISIMEAVSSSGGTLRTAALSRVRVLRRVAGHENRIEMNVDLQKIMNGKAKDLALAAGDILVIPDSSGKRATARAIEAAVQVGIMLGTYAVIR
jgi:polysaccharide export outer membrane protein